MPAAGFPGVSGLGTVSTDIASPGSPDDSNWALVVDDLVKIGGTLGGLVLTGGQKTNPPPTTGGGQRTGGSPAAAQAFGFPITKLLIIGGVGLGIGFLLSRLFR